MTDKVFGLDELENASKRKRKETFAKVFSRPKEELVKEAEEYAKKILEGTEFEDDDIDVCAYTKREMLEAILHFVEPREKQIQIDAEQIRALQRQNGELTDKVAELEAQIEDMKCCGNCNGILDGGRRAEKCRHCMDSKELSEWELEEK